jgi:hypothetical protein
MNAKERMNNRIITHGLNLMRIFPSNVESDPVKLCKKIHRLEIKAHQLSTDWCNGDIDSDTWEKETDKILTSLDKILYFRIHRIPVYINGDARGYALKIKDDYVRDHNLNIQKDWGGYGLLAPEFDGKL